MRIAVRFAKLMETRTSVEGGPLFVLDTRVFLFAGAALVAASSVRVGGRGAGLDALRPIGRQEGRLLCV